MIISATVEGDTTRSSLVVDDLYVIFITLFDITKSFLWELTEQALSLVWSFYSQNIELAY